MAQDVLDIERLREDPEYEIPRVCNITDMGWDGVSRALQVTPGLQAFAGIQFQRAKARAGAAEHRYKEAATRAYAQLRADGHSIGDSKELAEVDDDVLSLKAVYLEADAAAWTWHTLVKGLESRMDALQQISSRQKAEMSQNWRYRDPPPVVPKKPENTATQPEGTTT